MKLPQVRCGGSICQTNEGHLPRPSEGLGIDFDRPRIDVQPNSGLHDALFAASLRQIVKNLKNRRPALCFQVTDLRYYPTEKGPNMAQRKRSHHPFTLPLLIGLYPPAFLFRTQWKQVPCPKRNLCSTLWEGLQEQPLGFRHPF